MHAIPDQILPPPGNPDGRDADGGSAAEPGSAVRLVRDGPVPKASCPHCGGRLELSTVGSRWQVRGPSDVADRLTLQLGTLEREELHVLVLNTRNVVIDQERVYQGNVSASVVRVGELFRRAVERHGSAIILCHNHPSGETSPSVNDLHLTAEAIAAGRLLDIAVLDHVIVGGDGYASLRDYGVTFERREAGHGAGDGPGPSWRDPRYGAFKSAVQKHIRRGEGELAIGAATALAQLPGGVGMLRRRLPVVAAEDVGPIHLPAAAAAARACASLEPEEALPLLLAATAGLASRPKSKEAYWLAATCWAGRREAATVTRSALDRALAVGAHQEALALCLAAHEGRAWRSGARLIESLQTALADAPPSAQEIGKAALWREAQGGVGVGELLAAAVIAAIDRPADPLPKVSTATDLPPAIPIRLAWYTQDGHTVIGRGAMAAVARTTGIDADSIANLMFNFESIRLGPSELPSRWREEAMALEAVDAGWGSVAAGKAEWETLRAAVRAAIERALDKARDGWLRPTG